MHATIQLLVDLFQKCGDQQYADELVTQRQHAVQCGQLARRSSTDNHTLITAALLHDVGHLLVQDSDWPTSCEEDLDDQHEDVGFQFLIGHFGPDVAEPVRMHVDAKRYLCTVQPDYAEKLSPTSLKSFHDQGGQMSDLELEAFRSSPYYEDALELRRWDDQAKQVDAPDLGITDFREELETALAAWSSAKA